MDFLHKIRIISLWIYHNIKLTLFIIFSGLFISLLYIIRHKEEKIEELTNKLSKSEQEKRLQITMYEMQIKADQLRILKTKEVELKVQLKDKSKYFADLKKRVDKLNTEELKRKLENV